APASSTGRFLDGHGHVAHDLLHERDIVAFGHDADDGLGAGFAHEQTARAVEAGFGLLDAIGDALVGKRLAVLEAHIVEHLRQRFVEVRRLAGAFVFVRDHGQYLQCRNEAVARGREIAEDDVAGLFAAHVEAAFVHHAQHIAIAHGGAREGEVETFQVAFQTGVRHHGADDAAALEFAAALPGASDEGEDLVAVDDLAVFIGHHHAVGIAIERDAEIGAHLADLARHRFGRGGAAFGIDVETVGIDADLHDVRAQLPQHGGRHAIGGPVGAVDHDAQAIESHVLGEGALGEFDVTGLRVVDALGAADLARIGEAFFQAVRHQGFDFVFAFVGEFLAVGAEELDAVVFERIVRGRDHHAEVGAQRAREHRDGGRGQRAELEDVHADRGEARDERGFDHVARQARVLADHDAVTMVALGEDAARGHARLHREFGRKRGGIGPAPNTVGAEKLAGHTGTLPWGRRSAPDTISSLVPEAYRAKDKGLQHSYSLRPRNA